MQLLLLLVHIPARLGHHILEVRESDVIRVSTAPCDTDIPLLLVLPELLHHPPDLILAGILDHRREFVTAEAEAVVLLPASEAGGNTLRGGLQKLISRGMSVGVVGDLQVVDVKQEQRDCVAPVLELQDVLFIANVS